MADTSRLVDQFSSLRSPRLSSRISPQCQSASSLIIFNKRENIFLILIGVAYLVYISISLISSSQSAPSTARLIKKKHFSTLVAISDLSGRYSIHWWSLDSGVVSVTTELSDIFHPRSSSESNLSTRAVEPDF